MGKVKPFSDFENQKINDLFYSCPRQLPDTQKIEELCEKLGRSKLYTTFTRLHKDYNNIPFSKKSPPLTTGLDKIRAVHEQREKLILLDPIKYSPLRKLGDPEFYDHYFNHPKYKKNNPIENFINGGSNKKEERIKSEIEDSMSLIRENYIGYKKRKSNKWVRSISDLIFTLTKTEYFCIERVLYKNNITWNKGSKWLIEHAKGRNSVSIDLFGFIDKLGIENLNSEIILNFLKKEAFTIWIQKTTDKDGNDLHTKVNSALKPLQNRGLNTPITFDEYNKVLSSTGYEELSAECKTYFNNF